MSCVTEASDKTIIHIRNMVCPRCIMVVQDRLSKMGLEVLNIELGYAEIKKPAVLEMDRICSELEAVGFEYIVEKDEIILEKIRVKILEYIHELEKGNQDTLSAYLSRNMGMSYGTLSRLYSRVKKCTLQKYLVLQKIERVKELIDYDELSLSQIASRLGYSSVHYLSTQFKMVTGESVSSYKEHKMPRRRFLDNV
ncbi:AraC family transcriptional regulator [Cesiribacter sp. SM1]|uniref:helix-turn-helix domain-containing protein n=1 Tax=Cesiribacter sp. SM1 TaxID=2861196 RepID=UPI001CD5D680|nr:AraC family transcriptional regulator [Cesiribacter sp. SM1]